MQVVMASLFRRLIRKGRFSVHWPGGDITAYGPGGGPIAAVRLVDRRTVRRLALDPGLAVGEAYMEGGLVPVDCTIRDVLDLLLMNLAHGGGQGGAALLLTLRRLTRQLAWRLGRSNSPARAQRNVAHHYDLDHLLYSLFLDRDLQYSCAYFESGKETLDQAQAAKKRLIAAKLMLDRPGLRVLDIG